MTKKEITSRLFQIFFTLFGITAITFGLVYLAPGDPVRTMYISSGQLPSEEIIEQTREAMGLNEPLLVQYYQWVAKLLQGDLGTSYSSGRNVADIIAPRLEKSFYLAMSSLGLTLIISFPLGILAAVYKNKFPDYLVSFYTFVGISTPNFFVGTVLLYVVALKFSLLPVISSGDGIRPLILPSVTLAFAMSSKYIRQIRSIVLTELEKDYVMGAKSRGIPFPTIIFRDVLPNTLPPLITLLAISFGSLLSGVAVVEVIFTYPGIGSLAVDAISSYDYPLIQAYVLLISIFYITSNILVDISYPFLDPRMRKR